MFKKIFYNTASQLASRGIVILLSLVTTAILTRRLGVSDWGNYVFLTSFVLMLVAISDWGTQIIGVRELSKADTTKKKNKVWGSLLALRFLFAIGVFLIGLFVVLWLPLFSQMRVPALLALLVVFLLSFDTSFEIVFQSFLRMDRKAILDVLYGLFFVIFSIISLGYGRGLPGIILSWLVSRLLVVFLGWHFARRILPSSGRVDRQTAVYLLKESLPTGVLMILFTAYDRGIDSFFLKFYWGEREVGFYGLAYKIYSNLVLPAYYLSNSLFPLFAKSDHRSFSLAKTGLIISGSVGLLAGGIVFLSSGLMITILAGKSFSNAIPALQILGLALPFAFANHILGFNLIAKGKQLINLKIGAIALTWNLIFNFIFIPKFGFIAASWVTVSTEALAFVMSMFFTQRQKRDQSVC